MIVGIAEVSDLKEITGGQDVFHELLLTGRRATERVVQPEQVIAVNPDLILVS